MECMHMRQVAKLAVLWASSSKMVIMLRKSDWYSDALLYNNVVEMEGMECMYDSEGTSFQSCEEG